MDHHKLLFKPVLILPETAYVPKDTFIPLTRSEYIQSLLLGNKTLTGQPVKQYISLFPYLNDGDHFTFEELSKNDYRCKNIYNQKFLQIYKKYDFIEGEKKDENFFFINPEKSIRWNFNSNEKK